MDDNTHMIDEIAAFEADREWIDAHMLVLVERCADHWIAVKRGQVIAVEADLGALLSKVPDLDHICVEFINARPFIEAL
jgi:hypothetical protein